MVCHDRTENLGLKGGCRPVSAFTTHFFIRPFIDLVAQPSVRLQADTALATIQKKGSVTHFSLPIPAALFREA